MLLTHTMIRRIMSIMIISTLIIQLLTRFSGDVFYRFDASVVSVAIGGEDCAILSMADTQIICDTSSRPTSINTEVVVLIRGQGQSIEASRLRTSCW